MAIGFKITARDGRARTGVIVTDHGEVRTPTVTVNFTPALFRTGITPAQVQALGVDLVLVNTLHEHLAQTEDIHRKLGWEGPVIADSGGYQMISLASKLTIRPEGVEFNFDNQDIWMTPQKVLDIQRGMGVDMMMPLDYVVDVRRHNVWQFVMAVLRTEKWFVPAYASGHENLYYIVQGGTSSLARSVSLWFARRWLDKRGVQAVALGGISLGESPDKIHKAVDFCCRRLPANKPRHLLGVGRPVDLVKGIVAGVDTFDCVAITREARHGRIWTRQGMLRLQRQEWAADPRILEEGCDCPACRAGVSRQDLRAGLRSTDEVVRKEVIQQLMMHNVRFVMRLVEEGREAIKSGQVQKWATGRLNDPK